MSSRFGVRVPALLMLAVLSCLMLACGSDSTSTAFVTSTATSTTTAPTVTVIARPSATTVASTDVPSVTVQLTSPPARTPPPTTAPPTVRPNTAPSAEKRAIIIKAFNGRFTPTDDQPLISQQEALEIVLSSWHTTSTNLADNLDKMSAIYGLYEGQPTWIFNFDWVYPIVSMPTPCQPGVKNCKDPKGPTHLILGINAKTLKSIGTQIAYSDEN